MSDLERKIEKKIGLFGGTFDPVHNGHLNLAFELAEKKELDEVRFIPALLNPLKQDNSPASFEHRAEMIRATIEGIPQFVLSEYEKNASFPCYTVNMIRTLLKEEKSETDPLRFYFLMGEDSIEKFGEWHLPEEIVSLVPLIIGSRFGSDICLPDHFSGSIRAAMQQGLFRTKMMDISSTCIRRRLAENRECRHLLPAATLDYIRKNQLYHSN